MPPPGAGTLVLVATPIGNLGDLTSRAQRALTEAALICCEDTRRTGKLLSYLGISGVRMMVANEHTEHGLIDHVLGLLASGQTVVVASDAGTPGISDPGELLVRAAIEHGHTVSATPGPSADVMALVISGLPTGRYVFEGFVPRSGPDRKARLAEIAVERRTIVLYEAPHRLARTLGDLQLTCGGERRVALCRELTKLHEEVWRGTLHAAVQHAADREPQGEYVIVLDGAPPPAASTDDDVAAALTAEMANGSSVKSASAVVAERLGLAKNRVYSLALELQRSRTTG